MIFNDNPPFIMTIIINPPVSCQAQSSAELWPSAERRSSSFSVGAEEINPMWGDGDPWDLLVVGNMTGKFYLMVMKNGILNGIWWDIMGFDDMILVGGLGHYFYFSNFCWECHHPNWLSYLFRGLKAPIRWDLLGLKKNMWLKDIHSDWVCGWMKYIYSDLVDLNGDRRIWIWMAVWTHPIKTGGNPLVPNVMLGWVRKPD